MRKITLLLTVLIVAALGYGQTPMSGTFKVGTGEVAPNFALLSEAVTALNTNGLSGDVVLEITSDITESENIGLGVNTNGHSITIRPSADADRTITFTKTADNTSPTGHFVIGYTSAGLTSAWSDDNTIATSNVTIDGYAAGGSARRLTFTNTIASHTGARVIVVVGACENTVIKNCNISNLTTHTGSPFCVGAVVRKGTAIEVAPKNLTIDNNILTCTESTVGMGIRLTNSGTISAATRLIGFVCSNNTIMAQRRILEINYTNGGKIFGNTITLKQPTSTSLGYGIWTSNGCEGTFDIYSNKFVEISCAGSESSGTLGQRAISVGGSVTVNIYNNMFAGMGRGGTATASVNQTYIFFGSSGKIYNNTFYLPALSSTVPGYYRGINLSFANPEIKNNIFISNEDAIANELIGSVTTAASEDNLFYLKAGNTNARVVSTFTTLAEYQAANTGKDVNSKSVDVQFENADAGDLRIAGSSQQDINLSAPLIAEVATDILGATRENPTYKGAHQGTLPFVATSVDQAGEQSFSVRRTPAGVSINFEGEAIVEIYGVNGQLIEKTRAYNNYDRDLQTGIYIIRVNGKSQKFVR